VIVLLAALQEEISGLRRRMDLAPEAIPGLCRPVYAGLYRGRPVLLARTGMGRQRAEVAAAAVAAAILARCPVSALVSIGFSGALEARLAVGDLVLVTRLSGTGTVPGLTGPGGTEIEPSGTEVEPAVYRPDQELLRAAAEALAAAGMRVVLGPTVTTPGIATTPGERQRLASQTGAVAVDMESYWVARMARDRGLPFLALRAISDTQEDRLLPFDQMEGADGETSLRRLAAHLLREPGSLAAVAGLARNAARARRALTAGVACVVATL
jgi:nucleoside phosphorylase